MTMAPTLLWDATTMLEALGGADVVVWLWEPGRDRLSLTGASRALGFGPLAPECTSAAIRSLVLPSDRAGVDEMLTQREPGAEISARVRMRSAEACIWRGIWLEEGMRAAGVAIRESRFAATRTDVVTGLLDRRAFIDRARERLTLPIDYDLVVADLNRLRRLNEALGHDRADLVLAVLGSRLAAAFPSEAVLARIGEDEFAVITPALEDGASASDRLRAALEAPLRIAGFDIFPTLSIGVLRTKGGANAQDAAELLRRAELAVEAAKASGRGGAAAYERNLENDGLSRLALESDLRGAIGRGEIEPFFQPIVRLSSGELSGFEALARWRHPRRGLLAPDDFLGAMAEMGLMEELGSFMMRKAARQLDAWRRAHTAMAAMTIAVNLSTGEIDRPGLTADVAALVKEFCLPKGALKLEITEGDLMRDPDRTAITLRALREAGAGLALDDFGTGFSSLSYLSRLPFDTLKIDRYFVCTMGSNEGSEKIVRSVIRLGQDLSLEVVAEGVENAVMARHLLKLGCDYGQGFGYAPPLSHQEAEVYLNESYADGAAPLKARG
ncbi:MAG TPA: bifunctional diguanylate cyclase/phosphodiesterase [Caulobacteraceae bacterium]